jgi:hypothetical protein
VNDDEDDRRLLGGGMGDAADLALVVMIATVDDGLSCCFCFCIWETDHVCHFS